MSDVARNSLELTSVYRIELLTLRDRLKNSNSPAYPYDPQIDTLLDKPKQNWEVLYEAERRLMAISPDNEIVADFVVRLAEAQGLKVLATESLENAFTKTSSADEKRAVYLKLLREIHFRYSRKRLDRRVARETASSLTCLGYWLAGVAVIFIFLALVKDTAYVVERFHIVVALWFGAIGAYFSRMVAFQSQSSSLGYDDIIVGFSTQSIIVRLIVGMLGSLIVYLMISGQILGGELFPDLGFKLLLRLEKVSNAQDSATFIFPTKDFAKLLIWSTLAGFSERLVPDQFGKLEAQVNKK